MADSVTDAQPSVSMIQEAGHILDRLELWSLDHPEAIEYVIETEQEAAQILLAMVATMRGVMSDIHHDQDRKQIQAVARNYQKAVIHSKALDTFREMTEDDQLELYGMRLVARRIILQ